MNEIDHLDPDHVDLDPDRIGKYALALTKANGRVQVYGKIIDALVIVFVLAAIVVLARGWPT